ncbi:MAG: phosphoribosylglycinamide formyltransferase [Oscillospiraceae bacterium]|nr:phosphoribosylglycinamide formyltransferase [Oscillospiraceae bacterium]
MVRTAILVSGGGANLQAILDAALFGEIRNCQLCAVISSVPDAYALTRAENAKVPGTVVDYSIFPNRASFTEAIIKKLQDMDIELVVLAGMTHWLETQFFRAYRNKILFTHPSLIPSFYGTLYTGKQAAQEALAAGVRYTGATSLLVTDLPENAKIILQQPCEVKQDDTVDSLQRRIMEQAEWDVLVKSIDLFCNGKLVLSGDRLLIEE